MPAAGRILTLLLALGLAACNGGSDEDVGRPVVIAPVEEPDEEPPGPLEAPLYVAEELTFRFAGTTTELFFGSDLAADGSVAGRLGARGAIWNPVTGLQVLGRVLGSLENRPLAINAGGWSAGYALLENPAGAATSAVIWTPQGGIAASGGWSAGSAAEDINRENQAVGVYQDGSFSGFFLWQTSGLVDLGRFGAEGLPQAIRINDQGDIAATLLAQGERRVLLWTAQGELRELGPGLAEAINNDGVLAGCDGTPLVWSPLGTPIRLDPGLRRGCALDVNAAGEVVGWYQRTSLERAGFIYRNGEFHDLQARLSEPLVVEAGIAINDQGWILANGAAIGGGWRTLLLRPLQDPAPE